ncbi:hypothetical protein PN472_00615 [Microcystis aeruginosa CS-1036]|uniref:hypothetical protein n=1 Tax=Microcystis TaxID=1125 RepID=UPI00232F01CC|nr:MULTISPECIES: hypothetical protein [Microcystis]MDB9404919.1 hypothetical protein [Microcystis sp. CS-574]MDB9541674.1 hypothetical protein [Microcystis aeruginosa CS-1036]
MPDWSDVPLLYQAQIEGRCQLQRQENKQKSRAYDWVDQWTKLYHSTDGVAELSYESVRNRHFLKLQIMN